MPKGQQIEATFSWMNSGQLKEVQTFCEFHKGFRTKPSTPHGNAN
jgi:hypothetical protein